MLRAADKTQELINQLQKVLYASESNRSLWVSFLSHFLEGARGPLPPGFDLLAVQIKEGASPSWTFVFNALLQLMYQAKRENTILAMTASISAMIAELNTRKLIEKLEKMRMEINSPLWISFLEHFLEAARGPLPPGFDTMALQLKRVMSAQQRAEFDAVLQLMYQAKRENTIPATAEFICAVIAKAKAEILLQRLQGFLYNPVWDSYLWTPFLSHFLQGARGSLPNAFDTTALQIKRNILPNAALAEFNELLRFMYQAKRDNAIENLSTPIRAVLAELPSIAAVKKEILIQKLYQLAYTPVLKGPLWISWLNHYLQGVRGPLPRAFDEIVVQIKQQAQQHPNLAAEFDGLLRLMYQAKREGVIGNLSADIRALLAELNPLVSPQAREAIQRLQRLIQSSGASNPLWVRFLFTILEGTDKPLKALNEIASAIKNEVWPRMEWITEFNTLLECFHQIKHQGAMKHLAGAVRTLLAELHPAAAIPKMPLDALGFTLLDRFIAQGNKAVLDYYHVHGLAEANAWSFQPLLSRVRTLSTARELNAPLDFPELIFNFDANRWTVNHLHRGVSTVLHHQPPNSLRLNEFVEASVQFQEGTALFSFEQGGYHLTIRSTVPLALAGVINQGNITVTAREIKVTKPIVTQGHIQCQSHTLIQQAAIQGQRGVTLKAGTLRLGSTVYSDNDIHVWPESEDYQIPGNNIQAKGAIYFHWPAAKTLRQSFSNPQGSLVHWAEGSLKVLANQYAEQDIALQAKQAIEMGDEENYVTVLARNGVMTLGSSEGKATLYQGRLVSELGINLSSQKELILGRAEGPLQKRHSALLSGGPIRLACRQPIIWNQIEIQSKGNLWVNGTHLENISSNTVIQKDVQLEVVSSHHRLLFKQENRGNIVPYDARHYRVLRNTQYATGAPVYFQALGKVVNRGTLEIMGGQFSYGEYRGALPTLKSFIPYDYSSLYEYEITDSHGYGTPKNNYEKPVEAVFSVASSLQTHQPELDINGIVSSIGITLSGVVTGKLGYFRFQGRLPTAQTFKTFCPLLDYMIPSGLYESTMNNPRTVYQSLISSFNQEPVTAPEVVVEPTGECRPNTKGLKRLLLFAQEKELLVRIFMTELKRHFLRPGLTKPEEILAYLKNVSWKLLQDRALPQKIGAGWTPPEPCLFYVESEYQHPTGQMEWVLVPVLYLPKSLDNPRLRDWAGCLFSLGNIEFKGAPGSQLHIRGNMDAQGLVSYQDFEVVSRVRNTWTRYQTITHESKQRNVVGKRKTTTVSERVAITELQPGNELVAQGEHYCRVNHIYRVAAKDQLGSLVVQGAISFVDAGLVRNQVGAPIAVKQKGSFGIGGAEISRTPVMQQVIGSDIRVSGPIHIEARYGQFDATQITQVKNAAGEVARIELEIEELHFHELLRKVEANNRASEALMLSDLKEQARTAKRKATQGTLKLLISLPVSYYTGGFIGSYLQGAMNVTTAATAGAAVTASVGQTMMITGLAGAGAGAVGSIVRGSNPVKGALQGGVYAGVGDMVANAKVLADSAEIVQDVARGASVSVVNTALNGGSLLENAVVGGAAAGISSGIIPNASASLTKEVLKGAIESSVAVAAKGGTVNDLAVGLACSAVGASVGKSMANAGKNHGKQAGSGNQNTATETDKAITQSKPSSRATPASSSKTELRKEQPVPATTEKSNPSSQSPSRTANTAEKKDAWSQLAKQGHLGDETLLQKAGQESKPLPERTKTFASAEPIKTVQSQEASGKGLSLSQRFGEVFNAAASGLIREAHAGEASPNTATQLEFGSQKSSGQYLPVEGQSARAITLEKAADEAMRDLQLHGISLSRDKVIQILSEHSDLQSANQSLEEVLVEIGRLDAKLAGPCNQEEALRRGVQRFMFYNEGDFRKAAQTPGTPDKNSIKTSAQPVSLKREELQSQSQRLEAAQEFFYARRVVDTTDISDEVLHRRCEKGTLQNNSKSIPTRLEQTGKSKNVSEKRIDTLNQRAGIVFNAVLETLVGEAHALETQRLSSPSKQTGSSTQTPSEKFNQLMLSTETAEDIFVNPNHEALQLGTRSLGTLQALGGVGQMALAPSVGPLAPALGAIGIDNVVTGLQTALTGEHHSTSLFNVVNAPGEKTGLYGQQEASYIEAGLNLGTTTHPKALTFAYRSAIRELTPKIPRAMFSEVDLVRRSLERSNQSMLRMWDTYKSNPLPNSVADNLRLRVELAFKQAGILDAEGRLTAEAIDISELAWKKGSVVENPYVKSILIKDGGRIEDWAKFATPTIKLSSGQRLQIHYYKNIITNKIDYNTTDFKVKGRVESLDGELYRRNIESEFTKNLPKNE